MIPLIGDKKELKFVKEMVVKIAERVKKEKNSDIKYHIGTMIRHVHILCQSRNILRIGRYELMKRRVQITNCHRG